MTTHKKTLEIVAGPNGSGKTSFAESYFKERKKKTYFVNADIIASGLAPGQEELVAFKAGRIVLSTVKDAVNKNESITFESTLSGKTWLPVVKAAKQKGYRVIIYFLFLKNVTQNIQRVKKRVQLGGHSIPEKTIRRRYKRSFINFWKVFRSECDEWYLFDNGNGFPKEVLRAKSWNQLGGTEQKKYEHSFLALGRE